MGKRLLKYIDCFDAIEHCFFHINLVNRNKKAVEIAKKYDKPIIGTSDLHHIHLFGYNYSLIDSEKDLYSVFKAINNNKVELKTKEIEYSTFFKTAFDILMNPLRRFVYNSFLKYNYI